MFARGVYDQVAKEERRKRGGHEGRAGDGWGAADGLDEGWRGRRGGKVDGEAARKVGGKGLNGRQRGVGDREACGGLGQSTVYMRNMQIAGCELALPWCIVAELARWLRTLSARDKFVAFDEHHVSRLCRSRCALIGVAMTYRCQDDIIGMCTKPTASRRPTFTMRSSTGRGQF